MIIEIIEEGGIYAYTLNDKYLYIGKTKNNFSVRDYQHKNNECPTEFEKILSTNNDIKFKILYDCAACNLTVEQLDYLETCFIQSCNPQYNIKKIKNNIQFKNKNASTKSFNNKLTKSETILYSAITKYYNEFDSFSKNDIKNLLPTNISDSTLKRALKKFIDLNYIECFYTNNNNENIYHLLK